MKRSLMMIAVVAGLFAGCAREGRDVTGSYGGGMLAGTVVLSGIEGSPAGVEVSVRDTGMTATLGADGRFAFAGVPDQAILDFRRGDGIQASLAVSGNGKGNSVLVQLGRGGASKSPGRGNSGKDKREFEGVIVTASAEELVLFTSHKEEVTIGLSAETVIRKGNQVLTAADLTAGMRVHVKAKKVDDTLTALLVIVQEEGEDDGEDDERPELRQYEGTIVSASATELVVATSKKVEVEFVLTADTVIRKGNTPVAPEELRPGQRVHVKGLASGDGPVTAVQVTVQSKHDTDSDNTILASEVEVRGRSGRP